MFWKKISVLTYDNNRSYSPYFSPSLYYTYLYYTTDGRPLIVCYVYDTKDDL